MSKIIAKATLEEIRSANDIVEVLGTYLQVKRAGSSFKALCPFHKEKTPSFHVNPQRQIYHCFGCGVGGDVFKFVMEYENVDFATAARMLAERAGIRVTWSDDAGAGEEQDKSALFKLHEELAAFYQRVLFESAAAARARQYLRERELDEQTVRDWLIGYAPPGRDTAIQWGSKKGRNYGPALLEAAGVIVRSDQPGRPGWYDRFRDRVMFPIRDEIGRVIGFSGRLLDKDAKLAKYVNSPETAVFKKGRVLYALDRARRAMIDSRTGMLCEGQIDVIRSHTAGLHTAVAAQGTALTEDHARLLKRYADSIVIVLDADKAGQDASLRSAEVLLAAGLSVSIATLPAGEDPDSLVRKQGGEALRAVLAKAQSMLSFQIGLLRSRDDLSTEAGVLRAARAVLETIGRAPTAVQRDQMLRLAARELNTSEAALRQDLERRLRRPSRAETAAPKANAAAPAEHPREEVSLCELIALHPETHAIVRRGLPVKHLRDPACRMIAERLLAQTEDGHWNLMAELADADAETQRLAAAVQMADSKTAGGELTAERAVEDIILGIWRRVLTQRREELRRRMESAPPAEQEKLRVEGSHLTMDIKQLSKGWRDAEIVLDELTASDSAP